MIKKCFGQKTLRRFAPFGKKILFGPYMEEKKQPPAKTPSFLENKGLKRIYKAVKKITENTEIDSCPNSSIFLVSKKLLFRGNS